MKKGGKLKVLVLALFAAIGIGTTAISTMAWFTIQQPPLTNTVQTLDPAVTIDNEHVQGYKVVPTLGSNGLTDYTNTTVTKMSGATIATDNHNQDTADLNFDVPEQGIGYYLVKQNEGKTFKYKYNGVSHCWKFNELENATPGRAYVSSCTLAAGEIVRVRQYTFEAHQTVNKQIQISALGGNGTIASVSEGDATIAEGKGGTYKVWFDLNTKKISFEPIVSLSGATPSSRKTPKPSEKISPKLSISIDSSKAYVVVSKTIWSNVSDFKIHTATTYTNTSTTQYDEVKSGTNCTAMSDDGEYYYAAINSNVKDVWIKFKSTDGNTKWMAAHNSSSYTTFTAGKVHYISSFSAISGGDEYVNFDGWGSISTWYDGAENNPGILGAPMNNTTYSLPTGSKTYYFHDNIHHFSNGDVYAYAYDSGTTIWPRGNVWPGVQMTKIRDYFYSVTLPTSYAKVVFNNNDTVQAPASGGFDLPTTGTNNAIRLTSASTTSQYNAGNMGNSYKFYFYDPLQHFGAQPYIHYWNSSTPYTTTGTSTTSLLALTSEAATRAGLWSVTLSERFTGFLFANVSSLEAGGKRQTADVAYDSSKANKYYWITGDTFDSGDDSGKYKGGWYTTLPSTDTRRYYLFDNKAKLGDVDSVTRYAYAWSDTYKEQYAGGTLAQWRNQAWPGIAMTHDTTYGWYIEVSTSYDRIVFNNGGDSSIAGNQTADLTVGSTGSSTVGANDWHFVLSASTISSGTFAGRWDGQWVKDTYSVDLKYSFFTRENSSAAPTKLNTLAPVTYDHDDSYGIEPFYPTIQPTSPYYKADDVNGIYYKFVKADATTKWYTDPECTNQFTERVVSADTTLYVKMVATLDEYTTFYVDTKPVGWYGLAVYSQSNTGDLLFDDSNEDKTFVAGDYLFRVTLPSNWVFRVGPRSGDRATVDVNMASAKTLLYVASASSCVWYGEQSTNIGSATIHIVGTNGVERTTVPMHQGDLGNSNYFIYEHGAQAAVGEKFYITYSAGDSGNPMSLVATYGGANYIDNVPYYLKTTDTMTIGGVANTRVVTTQNYSGNARFNFYLTSDKKVSIVMVPDFGNGFYIMNYQNSTVGTNNYIGATKMNSNSDTKATYSGFYATQNQKIFIRSYINAVDTLYETLASPAPAGVSISDGVITFGIAGYYNIFVDSGQISIEQFSIDDFFKLNPLNTGSVSTRADIKAQKTSLILEIPFTTTNVSSTLSLRTEGLTAFIGVALYCSASPLATPYETLRANTGFYNSLASSASVDDYASCALASPSTTYYAYVLVDYIPGSYSAFNDSGAAGLSFYLRTTQA